MPYVVRRFPLPATNGIREPIYLSLSMGFRILTLALRGDTPFLYVLEPKENPGTPRARVFVQFFFTGEDIPESTMTSYLGTYFAGDGDKAMELHAFTVPPPASAQPIPAPRTP